MKRHAPPENTARVVALALFLCVGLVAGAWISGVLARFDRIELAALAGFAAAFALLTYLADRQVRAWVGGAIAALLRRSARPGRTPGRRGGTRTRSGLPGARSPG